MPTEPERRGAPKLFMRGLRRASPKHASAAEQESREWFFVCLTCGTARSYAEMGAVRYGAYSRGKRTLLKCPTCGRIRCHKVERRRQAASQT